ncbi:YeiH family protein [Dolosicoccus paucivorans]|uniref:Putative sulfate exporter family transporter n=1 Tax=Dolosicoccus paucivorans TaxID=84521 RepID=A0A1G8LMJ9_9LACT|nr:putative sulfate exporter family transporter [Dolosicoccus paucivorans]PMB83862.1 putative sulfate exporter family transporter [Dolosicoccus paucivorans]PMC58083.1 putative sulfate exporter family transporter [Dolosicoccus paucivorans]SDI56941.1 conserved hypothetical integral membrane protein [Dolosicoccus paucivorans]
MDTFFKRFGLWTLVSLLAYYLGTLFPLVGGAVFALFFGMTLRFFNPQSWVDFDSVSKQSGQVLKLAIIALGFTLSFDVLVGVGAQSLKVTLFTIVASLGTALWVGKKLTLDKDLYTLIAMGTAFCGGAAITATTPIIKARQTYMSLAIGTIFLYDIVAVLLFPLIGHLFHLTDLQFGLLAGSAVNSTPSVLAAALAYSVEANSFAAIVKVVRTLLLVPATILLSIQFNKDTHEGTWTLKKVIRLVPPFILWFAAASIIATVLPLPSFFVNGAKLFNKLGITFGVAGVGMGIDLKEVRQTGVKPFLVGGFAQTASLIVSLICIHLFF